MYRMIVVASSMALAGVVPGWAQETENCRFMTNSGALHTSYEQVGAEACMAQCSGRDDCGAWMYTPHNFSPKSAPGECILYSSAGDAEPDDRLFCGEVSR